MFCVEAQAQRTKNRGAWSAGTGTEAMREGGRRELALCSGWVLRSAMAALEQHGQETAPGKDWRLAEALPPA